MTRYTVCCVAGTITGDVRVSGHPKVQETFARIMGYVEQNDIHSPHVRLASRNFKRFQQKSRRRTNIVLAMI